MSKPLSILDRRFNTYNASEFHRRLNDPRPEAASRISYEPDYVTSALIDLGLDIVWDSPAPDYSSPVSDPTPDFSPSFDGGMSGGGGGGDLW